MSPSLVSTHDAFTTDGLSGHSCNAVDVVAIDMPRAAETPQGCPDSALRYISRSERALMLGERPEKSTVEIGCATVRLS